MVRLGYVKQTKEYGRRFLDQDAAADSGNDAEGGSTGTSSTQHQQSQEKSKKD
jgi:hypothetical protein